MSEDELQNGHSKIVGSFDTIGLEELPKEVLMERVDRKYAFHESEMVNVLTGLSEHYYLIKAAGSVVAPYESLYLDTEDYNCYYRHHRGFKNREKIRFRHYPKTGTAFLEHKWKSNKGRTSKSRIPIEPSFEVGTVGKEFLKQSLVNTPFDRLIPTVQVDYLRLGFISKDSDERFSIDFNVEGEMNGQSASFGDVAILEVKQGVRHTSPVVRKMRTLKINEVSMSKYCLVLSMLKPELKNHNFKMALRRITRINHA